MSSDAEVVERQAKKYVDALFAEANALGDHMMERRSGIHGVETMLLYFVQYVRTGDLGLRGHSKGREQTGLAGDLEVAD